MYYNISMCTYECKEWKLIVCIELGSKQELIPWLGNINMRPYKLHPHLVINIIDIRVL